MGSVAQRHLKPADAAVGWEERGTWGAQQCRTTAITTSERKTRDCPIGPRIGKTVLPMQEGMGVFLVEGTKIPHAISVAKNKQIKKGRQARQEPRA